MANIATELGIGAGGLNLNDGRVRTLAGNGGGAISFSSLYGKSNYTPMAISTSINSNGNSPDTYYAAQTAFINVTASVSSGTGGYSYAWNFTSNPSGCAITNAGSATCSVNHEAPYRRSGTASFSVQCTVTDNTGHVAYSEVVSNTIRWFNSGGA